MSCGSTLSITRGFTTWHDAWRKAVPDQRDPPQTANPAAIRSLTESSQSSSCWLEDGWPGLDTRIRCRSGGSFRASGAVLSAHSRWLAQLIDRELDQVMFWDTSPEVTAVILRFLHMGRVQIPPNLTQEIRDWLKLLQVQDDCVEWHREDNPQNQHPRDLIFQCETCLETLTSANSARQHLERHMAQTRESFCSWMSQLFTRGHLTSPVVCRGCKTEIITGSKAANVRECVVSHVDACNAKWASLLESITKHVVGGGSNPSQLVWRKRRIKSVPPPQSIPKDPLSIEQPETLFALCENSSQCFVPQCRRPMSVFHLVRHPEMADILQKEIPTKARGNYECDYCDHFSISQSRSDLITHLVSHWEQSTPSFLLNYTLSDLTKPESPNGKSQWLDLNSPSRKCLRCSKIVLDEIDLKSHVCTMEKKETRPTTETIEYQCKFCPNIDNSFSQDDQRKKHQVLTHFRDFFDSQAPKVYPAFCDEPDCQFIIVDSKAYALHIGIMHEGLEKAMTKKPILAKKSERPSRKKPLKQIQPVKKHKPKSNEVNCQLCPTRFYQMSELTRHYAISHYYSRLDCRYKDPEWRETTHSFVCMEPLPNGDPCKSKFVKKPNAKAMQLHIACVHDGIRNVMAKDGIVPETSGEWPESQLKIFRKKKGKNTPKSSSVSSPNKKRTSPATVVSNGANSRGFQFTCQKCEESFPSRIVKELHTCHSILDKHFLADDRKSRPLQTGTGPFKRFLPPSL